MSWTFRGGILLCLLLLWGVPAKAVEEGETTNRVQIARLQEKVTDLKMRIREIDHDFEDLCKENRTQRRLLAEQSSRKSPSKTVASKEAKKSKAPPGCQYWLTLSSKRRHVPGCRYFGFSKGRPCSATEGLPCKICGGKR